MENSPIDIKLGLDFSAITDALAQIRSQFKGTDAEFSRIANSIKNSFNKAEAAAKLYGKESSQVIAANRALEKSFVQLGANGIDYSSDSFKKLNQEAGKISSAMSGAGNSVKQSNMQWTNLALVVQDLPFGFRGIQNNLPALIGGMAGVTGGIYLAVSAAIALFTAWDNGAFGAKKATDEWAESVKKFNDELRASLDYSDTNTQRLKGLVSIGNDYTQSEAIRLKAFKAIKEELTKVNKVEGDKIKNMQDATVAVGLYTEAIKEQNIAELTGKRLAELEIQNLKDRAIVAASSGKGIHPLEWFGLSESDAQAASKRINKTIGEIRLLESIQANALKSMLNNPYSDSNKPDSAGRSTIDESYLNLLRAQQQFHKDNLFEYAHFGKLILDEEERIAKERAKIEGTYDKIILNLQKEFSVKRETLTKETGAKWLNEQEKIYEEQRRIIERTNELVAENARNMGKAINQIHNNFSDERLKTIKLETDTALKLHKGFRKAQIRDLKEEKKKLEAEKLGEFITPEQSRKIDDLLAQNAAKLKVYEDEWTKVAENINATINGLIGDSIALLGEHIGNLMTGDAIEGIQKFEQLLAAALINIGKMLIQYGVALEIALANPDPLVAIAAGIAAVAIGTAIKNASAKNNATGPTKFANGGIISGPTYGLMGEYPGAKNNPEVVAPLDKLKEMMGSGDGQFVLRGQDLILAINRSKESLTLRRG